MRVQHLPAETVEPFKKQAASEGLLFSKADANTEFYGMYDGDVLTAFHGIRAKGKKALFTHGYVFPTYRGNGYYGRLIDHGVALMAAKGITRVEANCLPPARPTYLKRGFVMGTSFGKRPECAIRMVATNLQETLKTIRALHEKR